MSKSPKTLWVVRVRKEDHYCYGSPPRSTKPFGLEGVFASREEAEAFQSEVEKKAAEAGDPGPLLDFGSLGGLMQLSAFEQGVFRDWLVDHDVPDPATFVSTRRVQEMDRWLEWLQCLSPQQLADLYAALHHFRFYEIVEVPFVAGDYAEDQWDGWEKNLPAGAPPLPDGEIYDYDEDEQGYAEETDWTIPPDGGLRIVLPKPPKPEDEIPF